jgi:hypothetical protein
MSAVASAGTAPTSVAVPVHESAKAPLTTYEIQAAEQRRWMIWFGLPALVSALFVGAVFGTGKEWFLGPAIAVIVLDIFVLVWLAMTSDTNGVIGDPAAHSH